MKIIVGLGNPGKEYEKTRHNAGFMFVDALSFCREIAPVDEGLKFTLEKKFKAEIAETRADGEQIILVKPTTFMNSSGKAVSAILQYYKSGIDNLIVACDDVDLPLGIVRIRNEGSSGGHKGLQNIIDELGSDRFTRFRLGVSVTCEKASEIETTDFVLGKFTKRELPVIKDAISEGINYFIEYFGKKEPMPAHTLEVLPREERVEK